MSIVLGMMGCRPKGVLSSREMRDIIVDLHKTDALLQFTGLRFNEYEERDKYYAAVLEAHGTTQAQFDSSLVWYTAHPQFFDKIYPKVIAKLEAGQAAFETAHAEELELFFMGPAAKKKPFTQAQLDSVLWVTLHGYPSSWYPQPLVHDLEDEFFPQIGVLRGGVVDSLQTSVRVP